MTTRRTAVITATIVLVSAVVIVALATGGGSRTAPTPATAAATAPVVRTTLASRQQVSGTLEHAATYTLVFQQSTGVVTWLAAPGSVIGRGDVVYDVDGQPVRLLYGAQAAYRTLSIGITPGADVRQLQRNLIALGYSASGELHTSGVFDWATAVAVEQWQRATGSLPTGVLALGSVAFLPGPARVDGQLVSPGTPPQSGAPVLAFSSTALAVSVPLDPALRQLVHVGDRVQIQLPQGQSIGGRVSNIGAESASPAAAESTSAASSAQATGSSSGTASTSVPVTVALDHPELARGLDQVPVEVQITDTVRRGVLAVPVQALIALASGGYAVAVDAAGARTLIAVQPGIFDGERVQITSSRLRSGMRVEVPST
jgi:peptidoglycan hydrolase-like protein with peptidoglycan-binding domain